MTERVYMTFGDWLENEVLEGRTEVHLRLGMDDGVKVWNPVECPSTKGQPEYIENTE